MGYLSCSHIYRMNVDYMGYTLDFTGTQMLLTLKLCTMALDYYDGVTKKAEELKGYAKSMHVTKLPSLLEYYAYVYFFAGLLAGPAFNLREYLEFVNGTLFKDTPNKRMPSPWKALFLNTVSVLIVAVGVVVNMKYSLYYCRTDEFYEHGFLYRFSYVWLAATFSRFPYYFAWKLAEGSCILAGIGYYKTENGKALWTRATNCRAIELETAQNFKSVTDAWNIRTDHWLKHYIYERVSSNGLALTFLNSALWHGFYPGYYFSFLTASLMVQVARGIRRNIRPWFLKDGEKPGPLKPLYDVICVVVTSVALNYTMGPFVVLGFEYGVRLWSSLYFCVHIGALVLFLLVTFIIRPPKVQKKTA